MKRNKFNLVWWLLPVLLFLAWTAKGQSLVKYSVGAGSGQLTSSGNTLVVSAPFFSTAVGTNTAGSSFPGFLTGLCQKPPKPTVTISNSNTETPVLTSSANSDNQWYLNGNLIVGATAKTLTITEEGVYKVQVGTGACLSDFSDDVSLIVTGDIVSNSGSIAVYPNPVEDFLEIVGLKGLEPQSIVIDMTGRTTLLRLQKVNEVHRGEVGALSPGIYLLRIIEAGNIFQVKVLKK